LNNPDIVGIEEKKLGAKKIRYQTCDKVVVLNN